MNIHDGVVFADNLKVANTRPMKTEAGVGLIDWGETCPPGPVRGTWLAAPYVEHPYDPAGGVSIRDRRIGGAIGLCMTPDMALFGDPALKVSVRVSDKIALVMDALGGTGKAVVRPSFRRGAPLGPHQPVETMWLIC